MMYADDLPYWKTSKSPPDTWLSRAEGVIEKLGGSVTMTAKGRDPDTGRRAYLLEFQFNERFRALWPIVPSRRGDTNAEDRQAATMLYHDVKARSLRAALLGPRTAFFEYLLLPSGKTAGQLATDEIEQVIPRALLPP